MRPRRSASTPRWSSLARWSFSAAITAAAGCFYAQYFLFIDAGIAYGPWISIEALLAPIIGGVGTVFGPLLGALVVKSLGEGAKLVAGDAPGLDLMVYGIVLVLVIWFAPRGLIGTVADGPSAMAVTPLIAFCPGGGPWLSRCSSSIACPSVSEACSPSMPRRYPRQPGVLPR